MRQWRLGRDMEYLIQMGKSLSSNSSKEGREKTSAPKVM